MDLEERYYCKDCDKFPDCPGATYDGFEYCPMFEEKPRKNRENVTHSFVSSSPMGAFCSSN
jgi:hypothetical protein